MLLVDRSRSYLLLACWINHRGGAIPLLKESLFHFRTKNKVLTQIIAKWAKIWSCRSFFATNHGSQPRSVEVDSSR